MFTKFVAREKKTFDGVRLEFDVAGGNKNNILICITEPEVNSDIYILHIDHAYSDMKYEYLLTVLQDEKSVKASIKDGVLTIDIANKKQKFYEVVID